MPVAFLTTEDEKKYVKSINGNVPDENGNVIVDGSSNTNVNGGYLPTAGGTVTGHVHFVTGTKRVVVNGNGVSFGDDDVGDSVNMSVVVDEDESISLEARTSVENQLARLSIGDPVKETDAVNKQTMEQFVLKKDTTNSSFAPLGEELISESGWTLGAGWSGSFAKGFTHASGNTEPLTFTPSGITAGKLYQVTFHSSVAMTTTNLFVSVGNSTQFNLYGDDVSGTTGIGVLAADTSGLVFTPESSFTGTLTNISLREITGTYEAVKQYFDTSGAASFEIHVTPRGLQNVFLGPAVGQNNTSGHENTAVGVNALMRNTSGFWNSALGKDCLKNNTAGSRNIAIGYNSLLNNEVGQRNIAIGTFTMTQMKNGNWNIAIGADSMNTATGGNKNTAIGFNTLTHNAADHNVAVGADVLSKNTGGIGNIGIGQGALGSNTTGNHNVCIGYNSGIAGATASSNVGIGWASLYKNQTGNNNVAVGYGAGKSLTTGKLNILIGSGAEADTPTTNYQLNIGGLLKGSVNPADRYLTLEGGLRLPQIPTVAPSNGGVWNNGGVLMVGDGGLATIVQAVISALPVYSGEVE